jgi:hydrogenase 3 maturation protease
LICEQLQQAGVGVELIDAGTVPESYIQPIIKKVPRNLLIIDAIDFGDSPGTINIFKPEQLNSLVVSTHTLSPRIFVDMITQVINVDVYFIGVQPAQTTFGQFLSDDIRCALQRLVDLLVDIFPLEE